MESKCPNSLIANNSIKLKKVLLEGKLIQKQLKKKTKRGSLILLAFLLLQI